MDPHTIEADGEIVWDGVEGWDLELEVEMEAGSAGEIGVNVCRSPDGEEQTRIFYDSEGEKLCIDTRRSGSDRGPLSVEGGPFTLQPDESLKFRIFIDRSVVEVFANDRQAVMRPIYPTRRDSVGVSMFSNGGSAAVRRATAWKMAPSNPY